MVRLLSLYILRDLLKSFLLTAGVLVTVTAFGAAIKPLTDNDLLSASQTFKYIMLAMVPMLQFALPFAAGFASTITYNRMASDNEIVACAACGISYMQLLRPIVGLGLLLTLVMVGLTQWVIPRFYTRMQETIATDVARLFEVSIRQGRPFTMGNLQIYADEIRVEERPRESEADTRILLLRVVATKTNAKGLIETDLTAHQAAVDIYRRDGRTYLVLATHDTVSTTPDTGQVVSMPHTVSERPIEVPSIFDASTVSMTREELLELRANPEQYHFVAAAREELARHVEEVLTWNEIDESLQRTGKVRLEERSPGARSFIVFAGALHKGGLIASSDGKVVIEQWNADRRVRRIETTDASISRSSLTSLGEQTFDLTLMDCLVEDETAFGESNRKKRIDIPGVQYVNGEYPDIASMNSHEVLELARSWSARHPRLEKGIARLQWQLEAIEFEVSGRLGYRNAMSVTVMPLILLGGILAMWLRRSTTLVIYLWAFLPSVLDLILISGGAQMIRDQKSAGEMIMWSGNLFLTMLCVYFLVRLNRN